MKREALEEAHSRPRGVGNGDYIRQLWATEALRRGEEVRSGRVKTIPGEEGGLWPIAHSFRWAVLV